MPGISDKNEHYVIRAQNYLPCFNVMIYGGIKLLLRRQKISPFLLKSNNIIWKGNTAQFYCSSVVLAFTICIKSPLSGANPFKKVTSLRGGDNDCKIFQQNFRQKIQSVRFMSLETVNLHCMPILSSRSLVLEIPRRFAKLDGSI